jgi:hypothetical protein
MSAIRKLAVEATDNGLLAPEIAAGIQRVKSAKSIGVRAGNWLSLKQAQTLLNAPDIATTKGLAGNVLPDRGQGIHLFPKFRRYIQAN